MVCQLVSAGRADVPTKAVQYGLPAVQLGTTAMNVISYTSALLGVFHTNQDVAVEDVYVNLETSAVSLLDQSIDRTDALLLLLSSQYKTSRSLYPVPPSVSIPLY